MSIYRPTPEEKETIIVTNEQDGFYSVYTYNQKLKRRLKTLSGKYPDTCQLIGSDNTGAYTYHVDKSYLLVNVKMPARKEPNS